MRECAHPVFSYLTSPSHQLGKAQRPSVQASLEKDRAGEGEGSLQLSKSFSMMTHSKILCVNCVIMYMGKDVQIYVLFVADMILYL